MEAVTRAHELGRGAAACFSSDGAAPFVLLQFPEKWKGYPGLAVLIFKTVNASVPFLNHEDREFCKSISERVPPIPPL